MFQANLFPSTHFKPNPAALILMLQSYFFLWLLWLICNYIHLVYTFSYFFVSQQHSPLLPIY